MERVFYVVFVRIYLIHSSVLYKNFQDQTRGSKVTVDENGYPLVFINKDLYYVIFSIFQWLTILNISEFLFFHISSKTVTSRKLHPRKISI